MTFQSCSSSDYILTPLAATIQLLNWHQPALFSFYFLSQIFRQITFFLSQIFRKILFFFFNWMLFWLIIYIILMDFLCLKCKKYGKILELLLCIHFVIFERYFQYHNLRHKLFTCLPFSAVNMTEN